MAFSLRSAWNALPLDELLGRSAVPPAATLRRAISFGPARVNLAASFAVGGAAATR